MFYDPQYAQLCSEKTLQANREGFFLQWVEKVSEEVGEEWIINVFGKLKTDAERIRIVYEDEKICSYVVEFLSNVQEIYRGKDVTAALKRRKEGDACIQRGCFQNALTLYSQSVLKAPEKHEDLALALLQRSKLLLSMNEHTLALTDAQLCLKSHIPHNLKKDTFRIISLCYKQLGDDAKSKIALNLADSLAPSKIRAPPTNLSDLPLPSTSSLSKAMRTSSRTIPTITASHSLYKYASDKITVKKDVKLGRYVSASSAIKTGEVLVVEPAHTACLLPEKFGTHCHHCFDRLVAPQACPNCSSVAFCSLNCRNEALVSYHRFECKILDLLIGSGMSVLSLAALRTITQDKTESNLEMCTNAQLRPAEDFLQRTLMAAFLLRCLQKMRYFGGGGEAVVPTDREYRVGERLLYNLQMLQFNAHEVYETLYDAEHRLKSGRTSYIGVAIYPTVALFNHDCYPAVTRYFVGKRVVITSTRPLKPDDVIAENYGPTFTCHNLIERQRALSSRYWFHCRCLACLQNWSLTNNSNFIKRVRCPNEECSGTFTVDSDLKQCTHCHETVSLRENIEKMKWCEEQYELAAELVEESKVEDAKRVLYAAMDLFHRVAALPHRETHRAEEMLRRCIAEAGNCCDCLVRK